MHFNRVCYNYIIMCYTNYNGELLTDVRRKNYTADDKDIKAACDLIPHPVDGHDQSLHRAVSDTALL